MTHTFNNYVMNGLASKLIFPARQCVDRDKKNGIVRNPRGHRNRNVVRKTLTTRQRKDFAAARRTARRAVPTDTGVLRRQGGLAETAAVRNPCTSAARRTARRSVPTDAGVLRRQGGLAETAAVRNPCTSAARRTARRAVPTDAGVLRR